MVEVSDTNHGNDAPKAESFVPDIQAMMYGLGDCSRPLRESARLIETIVIDQIALIISQARDAMSLRGGNILAPEDILFLIKRNKAALKRFITYMGVKDEKLSIEASMKVPSSPDEPNPSRGIDWGKNRKEYCFNKLENWGISEDEILTLTDVIKEERTARACRISLFLTPKQYEEFHAARCKSFVNTNMSPKRFHDWLRSRIMFEDELTPAMLEILIYLAKETIASLVDMILSIREENGSAPTYNTAITIPEIQEAIRRHSCQQTLTFASFSKDLSSTVHVRFIAF